MSFHPSLMSARILQEAAVRYFLEVVNTGSIVDAARRLNVVPSAVSRQITRLEGELGTPLFMRQSRGMVPSKAGEILATYARRSQLDAEQISLEIDALRGAAERTIRIACTEGFAGAFLPRAMADFRRTVAPASFEVVVDTAAGVTQRVREAQADIGLTFSFGPEKDIHIAFSAPSPVFAIVASSHPLAQCSQVSFRELLAYPLALPGVHSTLHKLIDIYCSREGVACKSVLSSATLETLIGFTLVSDAVTFSGELFVRPRLASGELVALPVLELATSERAIEIQTLARRALPPLLQSFIERLSDELSRPPRVDQK
ncbi:LysR family transcriptional regulator [Paraburkholderia sp. CNPSo 3274]|uniref:LysR substrate-binding domain-containing protein n=1 Tax=Paraburkholderia sp. CNPSo 3274 TaxID=2940932 RepID=UPI0020B75FAF|nr:LysR family transcriptional regulator [Paraburkholderia sp. CNPSo 3274]MCP3707138.1 LysR family transcriptional regulator [Paraburkholderia sp. CNPSo 3274]